MPEHGSNLVIFTEDSNEPLLNDAFWYPKVRLSYAFLSLSEKKRGGFEPSQSIDLCIIKNYLMELDKFEFDGDIMKNNKIKKTVYIVFVIVGLFIVQIFASKLGGFIADLFQYAVIDKDDTFMSISVHHIIQMIVALVLIFVISKKSDLEFWLKPRLNKNGILYTTIFAIVILIYVLISYVVGYSLNTIVPYAYELNVANVLGTLGFQLFLSGTSEEILFRAFPITVLGGVIGKDNKKGYAFIIVIASVLFSVAHIQWSLFPVSLTFSWFQLIYAFILGIAYGFTYVKSESIIYPMIMHGVSNFFMVGIGYIFMAVMS